VKALRGFPQQGVLLRGTKVPPDAPSLQKEFLKSIIERDGASGETVGFPELGGSTLFTPPVANLNDTMVDPRCTVLYMQH